MMVVKMSLPEDGTVDIVKRTIDEKVHFRRFYDRIKDDLISQVEFYIEKEGNPEFILPLSIRNYTDSDEEALARKKSLIGLYSPKSHKLPYEQLEKIRKHNGLLVCPTCGEAGRPRTLDHYLPKDSFPEFSITLLNLTPMCDWCQGEKWEEYVTPEGSKNYIHPYFDDVNIPLYRIVFETPYSSPIISYEVINGLPIDMQGLVKNHLEGINFLTRFKGFFKTKYTSILRRAKDSRDEGTVGLKESLNMFLAMEEEKAVNSWEAVLYRSVLEDEKLLNFLENEHLPDNL